MDFMRKLAKNFQHFFCGEQHFKSSSLVVIKRRRKYCIINYYKKFAFFSFHGSINYASREKKKFWSKSFLKVLCRGLAWSDTFIPGTQNSHIFLKVHFFREYSFERKKQHLSKAFSYLSHNLTQFTRSLKLVF